MATPRFPRVPSLAAGALATLLWLQACGSAVERPRAGPDRPDVLIVTIDTARADHFSYYPGGSVATPNMDRVASEGVAFTTAIAPTPITLPSHTSLFTGLTPPRHGVRNNGTFRLSRELRTLAEVLTGEGYATGAFIAAAVLDRRYGLDQGFDHYNDRVRAEGSSGIFEYARRSGSEVVREGLAWLEGHPGDQPTFLWVHLFDAHSPYDAPEPDSAAYPDSPYAAGIAYTDRVLGTLLDGYTRLGRYDTSLMVVTADHGESLGEHGESTHGVFIYDSTLRIPLVIRGPGIPPGSTVSEQVSLVDLFPTVLARLGIPDSGDVDGGDLSPLLLGRPEEWVPRAIYVESHLPRIQYGWSELTGVRTDRWKLIRGVETELYDLESDPQEETDLSQENAAELARLSGRLATLVSAEPIGVGTLELSPETRQQLESLGYLSEADSALDTEPGLLPDPRQMIASKRSLARAAELFAAGDREAAIQAYRSVVAQEPGNVSAVSQLADLLALSGRYDEALSAYDMALRLSPDNAQLLMNRAICLERLGKMEGALSAYKAALEFNPEYREARGRRWDLMRRSGLSPQVEEEAAADVSTDPQDAEAHLALSLARAQRTGGSLLRSDLEQAIALAGRDPALLSALAATLASEGETQIAKGLYREVLDRDPTDAVALMGLARILLVEGRVTEAGSRLEGFSTAAMPPPAALALLAEVWARLGRVRAAMPLAERAVSLDPGSSDAWSVLGSVAFLEGDHQRAANAYGKALELDPENMSIQENLRRARSMLSKTDPVGRMD